jgi:tetratricopeptide (TPR) repeat protein
MSDERTVTLQVRGSGTPAVRSFAFSLLVDGEAVLSSHSLSPVESQEVREISGQYYSLFEQVCRSKAAGDYFEILGPSLFQLWFISAWSQVRARVGSSGLKLIVASDAPEVLSLPWELVHPSDETFLGRSSSFSVLRMPDTGSYLEALEAGSEAKLPPGPLRVLFAGCGPRQALDFEAEELGLSRALEGKGIIFDSCDLGTFEELRQRVNQFRPQVVHLAGQCVAKGGLIYFSFEGRGGMADLRSASELSQIVEDRGVQCIFISGCRSSVQAELGSLCLDLDQASVPMAVGWAGSMADGDGKRLIGAFYSALALGRGAGSALAQARSVAFETMMSEEGMLPMPVLYSNAFQDGIFDDKIKPEEFMPIRNRLPSLPGFTEGYAQDFVDRKTNLQRLMPAIREGAIRTLIITGPDGSGKSSLAGRMARELASEGFTLVPLSSSSSNPLSLARIVEAFSDAFLRATMSSMERGDSEQATVLRSASQSLRSPVISEEDRLGRLIAGLNNGKFLVVLDGLESNLDDSGNIRDMWAREFYRRLINLVTSSRTIITSRALPADVQILPSRAREHRIEPLSQADFFRFLLRDGRAEKIYSSGDLLGMAVERVHRATGGNPACLERALGALKAGLHSELSQVLSSTGEPGLESDTCEGLTSMLYSSLSPIEQALLCRAAAYDVPMNRGAIEAVAASSGADINLAVTSWEERGLAFSFQGLVMISSSLRSWLKGRLSPEDLAAANRNAGDFLRNLGQTKRSGELGLTRLDCALQARHHYILAGDKERARDITGLISSFATKLGLSSEVRRLNEEIMAEEGHPTTASWLARACYAQGDLKAAQGWYERYLAATVNDHEAAISWHGLASIDLEQGRYEAARKNFEKAEEIYGHLGDSSGQAASLQGLASIDMALGEDGPAEEKLRQVLEIQRNAGNLSGQASTLHDLISIDLRHSDYPAAREKLEISVSLMSMAGDIAGEAAALFNMGSIDMEMGDFDKACEELQRALSLRRGLLDRSGTAEALHSLAMLDLQRGDLPVSGDRLREALAIYQELEDRSGEAAAFFQLGVVAVQQGKINEGLKLAALSGVLLKMAGSPEASQVEPVVERLASQLKYSQERFAQMVREVALAYRKDRGMGLVKAAFLMEG